MPNLPNLIIVIVIVACLGWVAGFISSVVSSFILDRRKALHTLVSEIELIRSELLDQTRFVEIHARSVEALKPLIATAIPFLSRERKEDARHAFRHYCNVNVGGVYEMEVGSRVARFVSPSIGLPVQTERDAMDRALSQLQDSVSGFFPCLL